MPAGRNWIFLRGLTRGQGHWGDFLPAFRARFPEDDVECLDLAGNGSRFRETSFTDCAAAAADLRARSRLIREGRRVRLFGHSLGAMVAVEWMLAHPGDLAEVFLMNTSCRGSAPMLDRFSLRNAGVFAKLATAADPYERERLILSVIANDRDRASRQLPKLAAYSMAHPVSKANVIRQIAAAAKAVFPDQPTVPTVLIGARGDRLVSVENTLAIARKWGVEARIHPTAGHDLPIDDPEWLIGQFQE